MKIGYRLSMNKSLYGKISFVTDIKLILHHIAICPRSKIQRQNQNEIGAVCEKEVKWTQPSYGTMLIERERYIIKIVGKTQPIPSHNCYIIN